MSQRKYNVITNDELGSSFLFECHECKYVSVAHVGKYKRHGKTNCPECGAIQEIELNWRTEPSLRTSPKISDASITTAGSTCVVRLANFSSGGIGLDMTSATGWVEKYDLKVGDNVLVHFFFPPEIGYTGSFIITSIEREYMGLRYEDGQNLSPSQRLIEFQNRT